MPKGSKQRHITLSVEASRHARFSRAPPRAWRRYRDILAGPEAVFGGHRGPASGSGSDVSIRRLDHPGLADLAGENLKGADVVLQRGGGTPPVFPDFRQGLQVPAPEAVHGVNQKAWLLIADNPLNDVLIAQMGSTMIEAFVARARQRNPTPLL